MLVDFSVRNFRSIGDPISFSMIASSDPHLRSNVIEDEQMLKRRGPALLKSAVLFGANASGKTSFCKAIHCMRRIVVESATGLNVGEELPEIESFSLRSDLEDAPSCFEVRVNIDGDIFRYGFEATADLIHSEWLYVTGAEPRSREVMLFERRGSEKSAWEFGASFKGNRNHLRAQTRVENGLLLSKASQESYTQLTPVYEWFSTKLKVINMASFPAALEHRNARRCKAEKDSTECIAEIAKVADKAVVGALTETETVTFSEEVRKIVNSAITDEAHKMPAEVEQIHLHLVRNQIDTDEAVSMPISEESSGTRRFIVISRMIIDAFLEGHTVVVDEFEASLHVLLTKEILTTINNMDVPGYAAQFILASHDTNLLDLSIVRRDQVFLAEKNQSQTEVFSLFDLKPVPKLDASLERQYLADRFGGTPYLGNLRSVVANAIMSSTDGGKTIREEEQRHSDEGNLLRSS